jgi:hypothetical protein
MEEFSIARCGDSTDQVSRGVRAVVLDPQNIFVPSNVGCNTRLDDSRYVVGSFSNKAS